MYIGQYVARLENLPYGCPVGIFHSFDCILKSGVFSIEVVAGALALYRGALYEPISVYVVEVDRPIGSINRKLTKITPWNEMLILVGCHVIGLRYRMRPNALPLRG